MKKLIAIIVFASLSLAATPSMSVEYTCPGVLKGPAIQATTGDVIVESIEGTNVAIRWPHICSIQTAKNGISTEGCKAVYATLLAAYAQTKSITVWIDNNYTCSTNPVTGLLSGFSMVRID